LFRVAVLTCRGIRRSEARRRRVENSLAKDAPTKIVEGGSTLDEVISSLPLPDRTAIVLKFIEDRTYLEVGRALGTTEDAARMRVQRLLARLKRKLGYVPAILPLNWLVPPDHLSQNLPVPRSRLHLKLPAVASSAALLIGASWFGAKAFLPTANQS